jgi:hypothetical protein
MSVNNQSDLREQLVNLLPSSISMLLMGMIVALVASEHTGCPSSTLRSRFWSVLQLGGHMNQVLT